MNKRFSKLAKKSGFVFWGNESWKPEGATIDWGSSYDEEIERFADLIIKKAIKVARKQHEQYPEDCHLEVQLTMEQLVQDLQTHFDIKED